MWRVRNRRRARQDRLAPRDRQVRSGLQAPLDRRGLRGPLVPRELLVLRELLALLDLLAVRDLPALPDLLALPDRLALLALQDLLAPLEPV